MSGARSERTAEPIFVDGIGPPLSQIREDYQEALPLAGSHGEDPQIYRDVIALVDEVERLAGRVGVLEAERDKLTEMLVDYVILEHTGGGNARAWAETFIETTLAASVRGATTGEET